MGDPSILRERHRFRTRELPPDRSQPVSHPNKNPKMEAIKLKMDALVKEKLQLIKDSQDSESIIKEFEAKCRESEKAIRALEKAIANYEHDLDTTLTNYISATEKLELAQATATASELDVNALERKIKLVQEESSRVDERYRETIAEEADHKYEEVLRKAKIVESDLDRINEKAEDFEQKIAEYDTELQEKSSQLRKMEDKCGKNADQEDKLDNEQRSLIDQLKIAETNAEFGESTVEKLE